MTNTIQAVKKIILLALPALLFSSSVWASEPNSPVDTTSSLYRYSALENKIYFGDATIVVDLATNTPLENIDPAIADMKKLQEITNRQKVSIERSEAAMKVIENADRITSFLIGNNLGILKFQTTQMKDQIYGLNSLFLKTKDTAIKPQISKLLESLNKEEQKVENFILEQGGRFSLFGWLVGSL